MSAPVKVSFAGVPKRPPPPKASVSARVWSSQQDAIFAWGMALKPGKHLLVRARAGTGKSTSIEEMVNRAPERKILVCAFNREIAQSMQKRFPFGGRVDCKTLHGLGLRFIKYAWGKQVRAESDGEKGKRALSLSRKAAPDAPEHIVKLITRLHTKTRELEPVAKAAEVQGIAWRFDMVPDDGDDWTLDMVVAAVLRALEFAKARVDVIDFADMIFLPCVHNMPKPWYEMVVVDEAQDMTAPQLWLARRACRSNGRIVIVGDDRQAIYAFRGADSGSLDRLKEELQAEEMGLTATYRCGKRIVALAQQLVPDYVCGASHEGEIVKRDEESMLDEAREGDFILSRLNAPLVTICMQLLKRGVRARVKGRDIGKGIIALIRKLHAPTVADVPALLEARTQKELVAASDITDEDMRAAREQFVRDQQGIVLALMQGAQSVDELCRRCDELFSDDAELGAVMCSSVHKAKGLEAERVYLLEGTFRRHGEEDNLCYVAITRAKTTLALVSGFGKGTTMGLKVAS